MEKGKAEKGGGFDGVAMNPSPAYSVGRLGELVPHHATYKGWVQQAWGILGSSTTWEAVKGLRQAAVSLRAVGPNSIRTTEGGRGHDREINWLTG
jgi:hypothetical protein